MWSEPPPPPGKGGGGVYMGLHKNVSTSSRNRPRGPGEMKSEERPLALARAPSAFISARSSSNRREDGGRNQGRDCAA